MTSNERPTIRSARRRAFLKMAAATGALATVGSVSTAQQSTFVFEGHIGAWEAKAPSEIEGQDNPTLELEAGQNYVVEWTNADGLPHNFVIVNGDGEELVRSDIVEEKGVTQTVEFQATEEMTEYFCEFHPKRMRGQIETGDGDQQEGDEEEIVSDGDSIGLETVAEGLTSPTGFEYAPDDSGRHFVVDQTGQVYVHGEDGLEEDPFLDISNRLVDLGIEALGGYDERGLLGFAFHPDFAENRKFYVRYSAPRDGDAEDGDAFTGYADADGDGQGGGGGDGDGQGGDGGGDDDTAGKGGTEEGEYDHTDVLAEFEASEDLSTADPDSERRLWAIPSPQDNHNGGAIVFGPDGYLYTSIGDGGDANDTGFGHVEDWYDENDGGNGQDTSENLLGGVHRLDVDQEGDDKPYAIPEDNPLVDEDGQIDEYFAWGFRNPWRISFDSDGNLFVADAGQNLYEEVNLVERGGNYGWNVKEGTHCFSTDSPNNPPDDCPDISEDGEPLLDPIIEYEHRESTTAFIDGSVVIGGYRYESDTVSALEGTYVFGNWSGAGVRDPEGQIFVATPPAETDDGRETEDVSEDTDAGNETETVDETEAVNESEAVNGTEAVNETDATNQTNATDETETPGDAEGGAETIELGGRTPGWQGRSPSSIEGETNPTLELEAGTTYEVTWENVDGVQHNIVIEDADGNALVETEIMGEQGETQTVEFEATEEMAEYYCAVHPTSMRGDVSISGGASNVAAGWQNQQEELWSLEELVIANREDGNLDSYVNAFGRDEEGELYVLTSENYRPTGDTGAVHKLVSADEGTDNSDGGST